MVDAPLAAPYRISLRKASSRAALTAWLNAPAGVLPLVILRVAFGVLMFVSTLRFILNGWVTAFYVTPGFHFTYLGFTWVRPLPEAGMYLVFGVLLVLCVLIVLGACYRLSMAAFFILFTYVELLDKAYYLNHYYFISLLSFLLIVLPLNRFASVDAWRNPALRVRFVPCWTLLIIRLQVSSVYFFAGLAKLNPDWLFNAQPLRIWLPPHADLPVIGGLFLMAWFPYAMSLAGAAYDLTIAFWLSWHRTRSIAYLAVIGFHVMTALLFPIGMFPWIMIVITLIFFDERDWAAFARLVPARIWAFSQLPDAAKWQAPRMRRHFVIFLSLFLLVQMLLPLRYLLYPGNPNWTQQGFRFAWRVMLVESAGQVTFFVRNPATGKEWETYPGQYLNTTQQRQMAFQPDMIHEFALYLEGRFAAEGYADVEVRAEAYVTSNGRASRLIIDPTVDLTRYPRSLLAQPWILP